MDVSIKGAIFLKGIWGQWKISVYQMCAGADFPYLSCPIPLPQPCPSAASYKGEQRLLSNQH